MGASPFARGHEVWGHSIQQAKGATQARGGHRGQETQAEIRLPSDDSRGLPGRRATHSKEAQQEMTIRLAADTIDLAVFVAVVLVFLGATLEYLFSHRQ